ncbi:MAG TPA: DUF4149 domain-containing protein [Candidatus Poseidoniaceae archaeon]|nr:MAG TPA: DUF4149 domain-containing protein [Candidatus Poseidoniales archaeon]HII30499.1 DUF4149 domain-containing protein [Candidatus Poseidoniaceae archaeon]|tara:strand:+ start:634 stop:1020 length:387 start_codon:yes stop_codon:yes gene_type:complete
MSKMHNYIPGTISGIILFQTAIIAPVLFRNLDINDFGKVIRIIWPKFFAIIAALAAVSIGLTYSEGGSTFQFGITVFTCVAGAICYLIIPATNRASDIGDKKKFDLLHKVSVYSTVLMLIANIAYPFV